MKIDPSLPSDKYFEKIEEALKATNNDMNESKEQIRKNIKQKQHYEYVGLAISIGLLILVAKHLRNFAAQPDVAPNLNADPNPNNRNAQQLLAGINRGLVLRRILGPIFP